MKYDLAFPHLNIFIEHLSSSLNIGNFSIAYYGIIISLAMLIGFSIVLFLAKKSKQVTETYYDLFIIIIIASIIGARTYYVIFNWDYYSNNPSQILNLRAGGLAIYGGVIFGLIAIFSYSKLKRISFMVLADTIAPSLALGQAIGRWGNFFNMEAFGDYTNNIFAMQLNRNLVSDSNITVKMIYNLVRASNGETYIQVHPTFLYESIGCLIIFILLFYTYTHKKYHGTVFALYMIFYGVLRFLIESLRTDSLMIPNTSLRVSQIVSCVLVVVGITMIIKFFVRFKNESSIS